MNAENLLQACPEWKERIAVAAAARAKNAPSRAELDALRGHLLVCAPCRRWSEQVEAQSRAMTSLPRVKAPQSLDWRVSEEIRNPENFTHRWLKRLRRAAAPAELWGRLREDISIEREERRVDRNRLRRWTRWSAAAAACLVVAVGGTIFLQRAKWQRSLPLSVRDVNDPSGLSISSGGLLEGAFGAQAPKKKN